MGIDIEFVGIGAGMLGMAAWGALCAWALAPSEVTLSVFGAFGVLSGGIFGFFTVDGFPSR